MKENDERRDRRVNERKRLDDVNTTVVAAAAIVLDDDDAALLSPSLVETMLKMLSRSHRKRTTRRNEIVR